MHSILLGSLTPDLQRQLDAQYPLKIDAPDGSRIPVSYAIDPPAASVKLQFLWDSRVASSGSTE
jgi:hypothetical protein